MLHAKYFAKQTYCFVRSIEKIDFAQYFSIFSMID